MAWFDDFSNPATIAEYTPEPASTWSISAGQLHGPNQQDTFLYKTGYDEVDAWIEILADTAQSSGIALRFQGELDFYALLLSDNSGSFSTNNFRLWKRVSGTWTQLGGGANLTWVRGVEQRIRFEVIDMPVLGTTLLRTFFNGQPSLSALDSDHYAQSGGFAFRTTNVNNNRFNQVELDAWQPDTIAAFDVGFDPAPVTEGLMPDVPSARPVYTAGTTAAFPIESAGGGAPVNPTHGYATSG